MCLYNKLLTKTSRTNVIVRLTVIVPAQEAALGGKLGPYLGMYGVDVLKFCSEFNRETQFITKGVPVAIYFYVLSLTGSFVFFLKGPIVSSLLYSGSMYCRPMSRFVWLDVVYKIALLSNDERFLHNLKAKLDYKSLCRSIIGTAKSHKIFVYSRDLGKPKFLYRTRFMRVYSLTLRFLRLREYFNVSSFSFKILDVKLKRFLFFLRKNLLNFNLFFGILHFYFLYKLSLKNPKISKAIGSFSMIQSFKTRSLYSFKFLKGKTKHNLFVNNLLRVLTLFSIVLVWLIYANQNIIYNLYVFVVLFHVFSLMFINTSLVFKTFLIKQYIASFFNQRLLRKRWKRRRVRLFFRKARFRRKGIFSYFRAGFLKFRLNTQMSLHNINSTYNSFLILKGYYFRRLKKLFNYIERNRLFLRSILLTNFYFNYLIYARSKMIQS